MTRNRMKMILRILVGVAFLFFGAIKFVRPEVHGPYFEIFPAFLMPLTGVAEIALGGALLAGFRARWSGYALALIMAGAVYSHVVVGLSPQVAPALVLGVLSAVVGHCHGPQSKQTSEAA